MNLNDLIHKYIFNGYEEPEAIAKVCQDVILLKLDKSNFKNHITIKGGVVMHSISKDKRRATRNLDLDFIKYSLDDEHIKAFIEKLNSIDDGVKINIIGNIIKLHHQDYEGKRVNISLLDNYENIITSKLDIGVHKDFNILQDEYCFDMNIINEHANLLINSCEQIFVEKLKSLLKFGIRSTRYKDIFDFYYLINYEKLDKNKLIHYIDILILKNKICDENSVDDIIKRIKTILNNRKYKNMLNTADNNWLEMPIDEVIKSILKYLEEVNNVEIYSVNIDI